MRVRARKLIKRNEKVKDKIIRKEKEKKKERSTLRFHLASISRPYRDNLISIIILMTNGLEK